MKTLVRTVLGLGVLAGLAGCAKENIIPDGPSDGEMVKVTFSATQEGAQTRTSVGADGKAVNWSEPDAISVFDGTSNTKYTLTSGAGETSATFDSDAEIQKADSYIALYPYQSGVSMSDGTLSNVTLKSEQTAVVGSFDPGAALMLAQTESGSLSLAFKNVVGYVKVTPMFDCKKITFVRNGESGILAGKLSLKMNGDTPSIAGIMDGSPSVSISGDIKSGSAYYIAVLPVTLSSGFRLVFTDAAGKEKYRESSKDPDINKSKVVNLGAISESDLKEKDTTPYVTFSADAEQTFNMTLSDGVGPFQYSVGNGNWTDLSSGADIGFGGASGSLRLRGKSNVGTATSDADRSQVTFTTEAKVTCTGDIRTLVDYENYSTVSTDAARFCGLFKDCTQLVSAPSLPATVLANKCYSSMFSGTGLTSAPALPATELADSCYYEMFRGCTSLESAPELNAENLAEYCYASMFYKCSKLSSVPELKSTSLAKGCYSSMFSGCKSLTFVPENLLPAENLAPSCYMSMFSGTSLTAAPKLPAKVLTSYCYYYMFASCENLASVPELPATSLEANCYEGMFYNCIGLTSVPEDLLPVKTLTEGCYKSMFSYCKGLTSTPALQATALAKDCYASMFSMCTNLVTVPEVLPAKTLAEFCYAQMFNGCSKLQTAPRIDATTLAKNCCLWMFEDTALTESPVLKAETLVDGCYRSMFEGCSSLVKVTIKAKSRGDASYPLDGWLGRTSRSGGVIYKSAGLKLENSEIPSGWTVKTL